MGRCHTAADDQPVRNASGTAGYDERSGLQLVQGPAGESVDDVRGRVYALGDTRQQTRQSQPVQPLRCCTGRAGRPDVDQPFAFSEQGQDVGR